MPGWINRTQGVAARNGTNTHDLPITQPAAGSRLVLIAIGGVTSTTPAGWSLVASAINNTGSYVWTKTATGSETSSGTITHNGSNFPLAYVCYEYPAGSTIAGTVGTLTNQGNTAWATVTGLPGTPVSVVGVASANYTASETGISVAFTAPWVEDVDSATPAAATEGCWLGVCYQDGVTATTATPAGTITKSVGINGERITFAVAVAGGGGGPITGTTGQPSETDSPLASGRRKTRTTAEPAETDAPLASGRRKTRTTAQLGELDTVLAGRRVKVRTTGIPAETDSPLASVDTTTVLTGLPAELDVPLPGRRVKVRTTGLPAELDAALATAGRRKTRTTGLPAELDTVLPALLLVIPGRPVAGARPTSTATASSRPSTVEASDR